MKRVGNGWRTHVAGRILVVVHFQPVSVAFPLLIGDPSVLMPMY